MKATADFLRLDTRKTGQVVAEAEPGRKLNQHGPKNFGERNIKDAPQVKLMVWQRYGGK